MGNADGHHGKRALKEVTVQQLETAIAAALYKITAHKYHVDIKRFDLDLDLDHDRSLRDGAMRDGAIIEMRVIDSGMALVPSPNRFCIDVQQAACPQKKEPGLADQARGSMQVDAKN